METFEISTKKMSATELKRKQLGSGSVRSLRQKRSKIGALSLSARLTQPNSSGCDEESGPEESAGAISEEEVTARCECIIVQRFGVCSLYDKYFVFFRQIVTVNLEEGGTPQQKLFSQPPDDILVSPMKRNDKELACERLGLEMHSHSSQIFSPYFMDPYSLEFPQVLKDCGGDGDCFFKYETNEKKKITFFIFVFKCFPVKCSVSIP